MDNQIALLQARQVAMSRSAHLEHQRRMARIAAELAAIEKTKAARVKKTTMQRFKKTFALTFVCVAAGIAAGWVMGFDSQYRSPVDAGRHFIHKITAPGAEGAIGLPAKKNAGQDQSMPMAAETKADDSAVGGGASAAPADRTALDAMVEVRGSGGKAKVAPSSVRQSPIDNAPPQRPTPLKLAPILPTARGNALAELEDAARRVAKETPAPLGSAAGAAGAGSGQQPQQGGVFVEIPSRGPAVPAKAQQPQGSQERVGAAPSQGKQTSYKVLQVMEDSVLIQEGNAVKTVRKGEQLPDGKRVE